MDWMRKVVCFVRLGTATHRSNVIGSQNGRLSEWDGEIIQMHLLQ